MGYILRGLRIASYLSAALGLLLIFGAIINNALFFYGIRLLFLGVVGIGATSLLRDRYLEGAEEEEYNAILPSQEIIPKIQTPIAIQSVLFKWYELSTIEKGFLAFLLIAGVVFMVVLFYMIWIWIGIGFMMLEVILDAIQ